MKSRVLVVEDNEALAENIAELFEGSGEVTLAMTAEDAVARTKEKRFDLAIVDIRLPAGGDGLALVPQLRALAPQGEVILVTGNATIESAVTAVRHGAFAYVVKPFDPDDLLALGERALAQVALRRERESLARELAASEALYRGVVETVEQLIVGLDAEGRVVFCNGFAAETTGYCSEEVRGKAFVDCFEEASRDGLLALLRDAGHGLPRRNQQLPLMTRTGQRRFVRFSFIPLGTEGTGSPSTVLAVGLDVTDQLEMERQHAENAAMAAMGQLTTHLAHEIRNPLNAAKLQLELLDRSASRLTADPEAEKVGMRSVIIRSEIDRLSRMLEEFLNFARPRGLSLEPVELPSLLEEVRALEEPLAETFGIRIAARPATDLGLVRGDREKLKQVLINLVGNAIEALRDHPGSAIELAARPIDGVQVEVTVADDGPGMDPAVAQRIFEPFVTTKEAGTGLGLPIVRRIVEQHGGEVSLGPAEGGGTIARFTLRRV